MGVLYKSVYGNDGISSWSYATILHKFCQGLGAHYVIGTGWACLIKRFQDAGYLVQILKTQYRMHPEDFEVLLHKLPWRLLYLYISDWLVSCLGAATDGCLKYCVYCQFWKCHRGPAENHIICIILLYKYGIYKSIYL